MNATTPRTVALLFALAACPMADAAGPEMRAEGAVKYACGGVGADERAQMKPLAAQANLELVFVTEKRGGYLAEVPFTLSGAKGAPILRATADGPICLIALAPGRYRVSATIGKENRTVTVTAGATGEPHRVPIAFPGERWDGIWASEEEKQQAREP